MAQGSDPAAVVLAVTRRFCGGRPSGHPAVALAVTTAVPAVAGRVLRFDGSLQHAVPRPADVWLAPFAISPSGTADELMRSLHELASARCMRRAIGHGAKRAGVGGDAGKHAAAI